MSATQIPLTFRCAPLPTGFVGDPQQLATAIVARLSAISANAISFFAAGSVAPTSNVGPWLKNDQTWYVWSDALATYIPMIVEPESLGYSIGQTAPDPLKFKFWFKLDGSNNPIGIFLYANGSWQDVYASIIAGYSTTAQMNAAISAAVGSATKYPFSGIKAANQTIASNAGAIQLEYPTKEYDPNSVYDGPSSTFTAPVAGIYNFKCGVLLGLGTGTPTDTSMGLILLINGASTFALRTSDRAGDDVSGRTIYVERNIQLSAGQTVTAAISITSSAPATWTVDTNSGGNFFQGSLIQ